MLLTSLWVLGCGGGGDTDTLDTGTETTSLTDTGTETTVTGDDTGTDPTDSACVDEDTASTSTALLPDGCGAEVDPGPCIGDLPTDPAGHSYVDAGAPGQWIEADADEHLFAGTEICAPSGWTLVSGPSTPTSTALDSGTAWLLEDAGTYSLAGPAGETAQATTYPGVAVGPGEDTVAVALEAGERWLVLERDDYRELASVDGDHIGIAGPAGTSITVQDKVELLNLDLLWVGVDLRLLSASQFHFGPGTMTLLGGGIRDDSASIYGGGDLRARDTVLHGRIYNFNRMALVDSVLVDLILLTGEDTVIRSSRFFSSREPVWIEGQGSYDKDFCFRNSQLGRLTFQSARGSNSYEVYNSTWLYAAPHDKLFDTESSASLTLRDSLVALAGEDMSLNNPVAAEGTGNLQDQAWIGPTACPSEWRHAAASPGRDAGAAGQDQDGSPGDLGPVGGPTGQLDTNWEDDCDADGLPDAWEERWGTRVAVADADQDPDGDGLSNAEEFAAAGDPQSVDRDGDGVDDATEAGLGTCPADAWNARPYLLLHEASHALEGEAVPVGTSSVRARRPGGSLTWHWRSKLGHASFVDALSADPGITPGTSGDSIWVRVCDAGWCVESETFTVGTVAGLHVSTSEELTAALDDSENYLIVLEDGTYEPVTVTRTVVLQAAEGAEPVIDATGAEVGILNEGRLTLIGVDVRGASKHCIQLDDGELTLRRVLLQDCGGSADGGAIHSPDHDGIELTDVVIDGSRGVRGGALYLEGGNIYMERVAIVNSVAEEGGAIYATLDEVEDDDSGQDTFSSDLHLDNVVLANNSATVQWPGIYAEDAEVRAFFVTVVGHTGGPAIAMPGGDDLHVHASIFADNEEDIQNPLYSLLVTRSIVSNPVEGTRLEQEGDLLLTTPPTFETWTAGLSWADLDLRLAPGSAGVDGAPEEGLDADGTPADLGAWGGRLGGGWLD